jgi:hypothetical protein
VSLLTVKSEIILRTNIWDVAGFLQEIKPLLELWRSSERRRFDDQVPQSNCTRR